MQKEISPMRPQSFRAKERPQFQMIFQDPYASLDPRMTVFDDMLAEPLLFHKIVEKEDVEKEVQRLMKMVASCTSIYSQIPSRVFWRNNAKRIAIARALA
jgi:ABC-type microcin C transport system duplicated ATPase subunit YejF